MHDYNVRALELHSQYAWDFNWIMKAMEFMVRNGMNTLVLHRNDFIDMIIYPGGLFGADSDKAYETKFDRYNDIYRMLYKYTPTRRSGPSHRRSFLKRVLYEASCRDIAVYIENKELFFPEILLELHPELVNNGAICANHPYFLEFLRMKYTEFFREFPQVEGIIVSPGTGESRAAINSNRCTCPLCQKVGRRQWYRGLLTTMYDIIHGAGRTLVIRDFVFDPAAQAEIAAVMEEMPSDVVLALKNTPHDYYPTFPENPRIGNVGNHRQWIEFDCMGQYFGWGIGIADLTEDFRTRLRSAKEKGADGAIFRTDWESLEGHSSFSTPNIINQYAGAMLAKDVSATDYSVYAKYLEEEGWLEEGITDAERQEALEWFASISPKLWPHVTAHTPYVDSCVFSDSSLTPLGYGHAYWLAEEKNSLRDWDPSKWEALYPTEENVRRAMAEKDEALHVIRALHARCAERMPAGLDRGKYEDYRDRLDTNRRYVEFYRAATNALVLARYVLYTEEDRSGAFYREARQLLDRAMGELQQVRMQAEAFYRSSAFLPHTIYTIMDPDRLGALHRNLTGLLQKEGVCLEETR